MSFRAGRLHGWAALALGLTAAVTVLGVAASAEAAVGLRVVGVPGAVVPGAVVPGAGGGSGSNLAELMARLEAVTAHAQELSQRLEAAAARDGGLRVALERAQTAHDDAQYQLDSRARALFMAQEVDPVGSWQTDLAQPDLRNLAHRGQVASLRVDRRLVDAVTGSQRELGGLRTRAEAFRAGLRSQAEAVLADQDRARSLLTEATAVVTAQRAAAAQEQFDELQRQAAALDAVSASVTLALTPAQTARTRAAAAAQAPVLAALEAAGSAIPAGYVRSGQTLVGTASWYGPGFVGRPTASGAAYDPEQLTCANKEVPLGTVLHVSSGGRSVNCLVDDRGPYVGDRVLDLSRAGSRALGFDGLADVMIEVLLRT